MKKSSEIDARSRNSWMKILILLLTLVATKLHGRIWTDIQGREIEAELVRLENDRVIVNFRGKETPLPFVRLSAGDLKFVEEWKARNPNPSPTAKNISFLGQEMMTGGEVNTIRARMSVGTRKIFGDAIGNDEDMELGICLPPGFDPGKPQKILWICFSDQLDYGQQRRTAGELEVVAKQAVEFGWMAITVDTHLQAKMKHDDRFLTEYPNLLELYSDAVKFLEKEWPNFKASRFAFASNPPALVLTSYWSGYMLRMKYKVVGNMIYKSAFYSVTDPKSVAASSKCDEKELANLKHFFVFPKNWESAQTKAELENDHLKKYTNSRFGYFSKPMDQPKTTHLPNGNAVVDRGSFWMPGSGTVEPIDRLALKSFLEWMDTP